MKFIKCISIFVIAIILSGCKDKNKLVCSYKKSTASVDTKQTITIKFKDEKVNSAELKINIKPTEEKIKTYWKVFTDELSKQYALYDDINGIKVIKTIDNDKFKYTLSVNIDIKNVKEEDLDKLGLSEMISSKKKKDNIKKSIENKGFTCN